MDNGSGAEGANDESGEDCAAALRGGGDWNCDGARKKQRDSGSRESSCLRPSGRGKPRPYERRIAQDRQVKRPGQRYRGRRRARPAFTKAMARQASG